jgi:hypothetical protein
MLDPGRPQMTIYGECTLHAGKIKLQKIHLEYVMFIAFPQQQLLRERSSVLFLMYIARLVSNCVSQQHTNWFLNSSLCFGWVWLDSLPYLSKYYVGNFTYICPVTRQPTVTFYMLYLNNTSANTDIALGYLLQKIQFILQLNENLISAFSKLCADIQSSWHIARHQVQPCKL